VGETLTAGSLTPERGFNPSLAYYRMKALFAPGVSAMDWEGRGTPRSSTGNLTSGLGSVGLKAGLFTYTAFRRR